MNEATKAVLFGGPRLSVGKLGEDDGGERRRGDREKGRINREREGEKEGAGGEANHSSPLIKTLIPTSAARSG